MERPMSVVFVDETSPARGRDLCSEDEPVAEAGAAEMPQVQQQASTELRNSEDDRPMRLPYFDESCPHVRDHIIPLNGGHFNVDHYLRVLRAKAEGDVSIAMALTAVGRTGSLPAP